LLQIPAIKQISGHLYFGFDFPGLETSLGYTVSPVINYTKISLIGHPAPLILVSIILSVIIFNWKGHWRKNALIVAIKSTMKQFVPISFGISVLLMMALVMNDTGMTTVLAAGVARITGVIFPLISPFIGMLGSFMTGSNTNSNVMFGALQVDTARTLGMNPLIIASSQSIGGSIGSAISPAKVIIGSAPVGVMGKEGTIIKKTMRYCILLVFLVGLQAWFINQLSA